MFNSTRPSNLFNKFSVNTRDITSALLEPRLKQNLATWQSQVNNADQPSLTHKMIWIDDWINSSTTQIKEPDRSSRVQSKIRVRSKINEQAPNWEQRGSRNRRDNGTDDNLSNQRTIAHALIQSNKGWTANTELRQAWKGLLQTALKPQSLWDSNFLNSTRSRQKFTPAFTRNAGSKRSEQLLSPPRRVNKTWFNPNYPQWKSQWPTGKKFAM